MLKKDWYTERKIDGYTKSLINLAMEIAKAANKEIKDYFIGGGLAIDFSVGKITRNHHDIDFHPMLKDAKWWKNWFKVRGYRISSPADPPFKETYKIFNKNGEQIVDMWPLKMQDNILLIMMNGKYVDSWRHWEEIRVVNYRGINIRIENPERVLEQKTRHSKENKQIRKQDQHDFKLLGRILELTV